MPKERLVQFRYTLWEENGDQFDSGLLWQDQHGLWFMNADDDPEEMVHLPDYLEEAANFQNRKAKNDTT